MFTLKGAYVINQTTETPDEVDGKLSDLYRRFGVAGKQIDLQKKIVHHEKSKSEESVIKKAMLSNEFIVSVINDDHLKPFMDAMYSRKVSKHEEIIKQGDDGHCMYISIDGKYEIIVNDKRFRTFNDSRVFGELAILFNRPRLATVKALTKGHLWVLDSNVYQQIKIKNEKVREEATFAFLKMVPRIKTLSEDKLRKVADLLQTHFFVENATIVKEGDEPFKFYIITSGKVSVSTERDGTVAELSKGDFFGELAIMDNEARKATVKAQAPGVQCLSLSRDDFIDYLAGWLNPPDNKELVEQVTEIKSKNDFADVKFDELKHVAYIGSGGFGTVTLTYCKTNGEYFALKAIEKEYLIYKKLEHHALNEKVQINFRTPFIVECYRTFQDSKYIYFLMECCLGSDVWNLRRKLKDGRFSDNNATFYAASVLEALAYIHSKNYLYLDLKTENILIDSDGFAKLTDFGSACSREIAKTTYYQFGTPEYCAPEILYNKGYGMDVDYWTFGILIYELLTGKTPFYHKDELRQATSILRGIENVNFPEYVSHEAKSIVKLLCHPNRTRRLGCLSNGPNDIRNHAWFKNLNWTALRNRAVKPPFVPKLTGKNDVRYFDVNSELANKGKPQDCEHWEGF